MTLRLSPPAAAPFAIGALLARRMMEAGLPRLLLLPVLPLAFLFGPIGYLIGNAILLSARGEKQ